MSQQLLNSRVLSFGAGADLDTKMYYLVKLDTSGNVVLGTLDAEVMGTLQNKPKTGEAALVAVGETTKVIAGGTIAIGDLIVSDANGKAIVIGTNHNVFGKALEAAVSGDIFEILVRPLYK